MLGKFENLCCILSFNDGSKFVVGKDSFEALQDCCSRNNLFLRFDNTRLIIETPARETHYFDSYGKVLNYLVSHGYALDFFHASCVQ